MANSAPVEPILERCSPQLVPELKSYLARHSRAVEEMIRSGGPEAGLAASRRYAKVFDGLLCSLFHAAQAALTVAGTATPASLAAVGSYGRGAISFFSDLDVRLLCAGELARAQPLAEALLYPLWDAGLTVGHQVVTVDQMVELAREDLPTATSILDWRQIAGEEQPSREMLARVFEGVFGVGNIKHFLDALEQRAGERHERYGGSVYLLEPDVKNGPGGLRELDVAHWAARARWRVTDLRDLVRLGILVPREWQPIDAARNLLWRVRNMLHVHVGRRTDRLSFDRQEQLATELGYGGGKHGVEHLMSDYYRHARTISKAREMVVGRAMPPPTRRPHAVPVGGGLKLINGAMTLAHTGALESEPALALRLYDQAVKRNVPVYGFARDAVARATSNPAFCEKLRASEEAAKLFVRLCTTAQRTRLRKESVLVELHDVGLLVAMVPEFSPVVGRVHNDVYHVYTVDVHSVAAVDRLRALIRGEMASEYPLASRLAAEINRPNVQYFATLLHDVGKDIGGKNHSERGAKMAEGILKRLRLPEAEIREVQHLVRKHLKMYHVATRRDIDDPRTIEEFSADVNGREGLGELYLLTMADVSTTSPGAMTSWKARMLDELYVTTYRYLSDGEHGRNADADKIRQEVLALLGGKAGRKFFEHFLEAMPERYVLSNDPDEILRHARFASSSRNKVANVASVHERDAYVELGFIAEDRPGLLAIVTATLAAARLQVVGAQIYSWLDKNGRIRVLDLFWVAGSAGVESVRGTLPRLQRDFARLLAGEVEPRELVTGQRGRTRWSERPTPEVATTVSVDNRAGTDHTVIEVTTRDRLGLLFWLADALQREKISVHLAKINTEGTAVADVFYVTDESGAKLTDPARIERLESRIKSTIARFEQEGDTK